MKVVKLNDVFGEWVVIGDAPSRQYPSSKQQFPFWLCRCSCGVEKEVMQRNLLNGKSISCGHDTIKNLAIGHTKHGHTANYSKSLTYKSYWAMLARCLNPNHSSFFRYGGAGITVCERWLESFENFLEDMGERPNKDFTIDRIDGFKPYEPSNCRWATYKEQNNNLISNRILEYAGEQLTLTQWAERLGTNKDALRGRLRRGESVEEALSRPFKHYKRSNN